MYSSGSGFTASGFIRSVVWDFERVWLGWEGRVAAEE